MLACCGCVAGVVWRFDVRSTQHRSPSAAVASCSRFAPIPFAITWYAPSLPWPGSRLVGHAHRRDPFGGPFPTHVLRPRSVASQGVGSATPQLSRLPSSLSLACFSCLSVRLALFSCVHMLLHQRLPRVALALPMCVLPLVSLFSPPRGTSWSLDNGRGYVRYGRPGDSMT